MFIRIFSLDACRLSLQGHGYPRHLCSPRCTGTQVIQKWHVKTRSPPMMLQICFGTSVPFPLTAMKAQTPSCTSRNLMQVPQSEAASLILHARSSSTVHLISPCCAFTVHLAEILGTISVPG